MKLLKRIPNMRWIPHDISTQDQSIATPKPKKRGKLLPRKPSEPDHGAPRRRKSVISLTEMAEEELDSRTHNQAQSMFFSRMPIEIRKMVYEYVMGEETVHLTLGAKRRFGHFVCPRSDEEGEGGDGLVDCGCKVLVGGGHSGKLSGACLRLLRCCRRVYTEAILHLYAPHTFSLLHITHLLYLPSRIPQPRLSSIRTLHLRWTIRALPYFRRSSSSSKSVAYPEDTANWEKAWGILASMEGLRDLRVVLIDPSRDAIWEAHWLQLEGRLLEAVKTVRMRRAEVVLPYRRCRVDWDMGESGVRLSRPEGSDEEQEGEDN